MVSKAIETFNLLKIGHFGLGVRGDSIGSIAEQVHDGDTITLRALGNFSTRMLAIDTPEISFTPPEHKRFLKTENDIWESFLSDPFDTRWKLPDFPEPLKNYLKKHTGPGSAQNHYRHAKSAERALEEYVQEDMKKFNLTKETFKFFLTFGNDITDKYGRLLSFINVSTEHARPLNYNMRMLAQGFASPYFIWPNITAFLNAPSILDEVPRPNSAPDFLNSNKELKKAYDFVAKAREDKLGIFSAEDPLRLCAFELRYLGGARLPSRWLIDLSKESNIVMRPETYIDIPNQEDRLWIPEEYVPLFIEKGWRRG